MIPILRAPIDEPIQKPIEITGISDTPHFVAAPVTSPIGGAIGGALPIIFGGIPVNHKPIMHLPGSFNGGNVSTQPGAIYSPGDTTTHTISIPQGAKNPVPIDTPTTTSGTPAAPSSAPGEDQQLLTALTSILTGEGTSAGGAGGYDASTDPAALAIDALTPQATPTSSSSNPAAIVVVVTIAVALGVWFYFKHKAQRGK